MKAVLNLNRKPRGDIGSALFYNKMEYIEKMIDNPDVLWYNRSTRTPKQKKAGKVEKT